MHGEADDGRAPRRIQLSRCRGWRLPANGRSVAHPTRWANPFRPSRRSAAANAEAVEQYRAHLERHPDLVEQARAVLVGHDLACWCPPDVACHADVLLEVVGRQQPTARPSADPDLVEGRVPGRPDSDGVDQDAEKPQLRARGGPPCHEP